MLRGALSAAIMPCQTCHNCQTALPKLVLIISHPCLPPQYSLWLDGHSQEETLKFIRTALEACAAKAKGAEGAEQLLPLMRRLAA